MQRKFTPFPPSAVIDENYKILIDLQSLSTLGGKPEENELWKEIREPTISVAKYADVRKIPNDKVDNSIRDDSFEYFRADMGMNINVPRGKIKEIRFKLYLLADGKQGGAYAIDGFPNDKVTHIPILEGQIKLGINNLLKIIPHPITQTASELIEVDLNPWQIKWGYDKLEKGFSEAMNDTLDWYLSSDNVNQSFNSYITLKKKKSVKQVTGNARAIWAYEPDDEGVKNWFKSRFGRGNVILKSDEKEIDIVVPVQ